MEQQIGPYEVVAELGRGGMGVVYKARDTALERFVAIKVLGDKVADEPELIARFQREARSAASLNHPNVIQIYNIGEQDGQPYFVMEFVAGQSLSQMIRTKGRLPLQTAARILVQAASGLGAAHEQEIIHRDIKPGNLMIDPRGNVKIADFGIAYMAELGNKLTGTGQFLGTPGYLSPELCQGHKLDGRADIFSLGVVFFEMLTGQQPFQAESPFAMIHKVVQAPLPNAAQLNPEVDQHTIAILDRMVAKNPDERYPDCNALIADLERFFGVQTYRTLGERPPEHQAGGAPVVADADLAKTATDADLAPTEFVASSGEVPPPPPPVPTQAAVPAPPPPVATQATVPSPPPPVATQAAVVPPAEAASAPPPPRPAEPTPKQGFGKGVLALAALIFIVGGGLGLWLGRNNSETTEPADPSGEQVVSQNDAQPTEPPPTTDQGALQASSSQGSAMDPAPTTTNPEADQPPAQPVGSETVPVMPDSSPVASANQSGMAPAGEPEPAAQASTAMGHEKTSPADGVETTTFSEAKSEPVSEPSGASPPVVKRPRPRRALPNNRPLPRADGKRAARPKPAVPNVVVAVLGDPAISEPIRNQLEQHLARDDYPILALDDMGDPGYLIRQDPIPIVRLRQALKRHETDVLVLVRLDDRGERELNYMGRSQTAWQAQVKVDVLSLHQPTPLGRRQGDELLEYTNLNATRKGKIAALKIYRQVSAFMERY